MPAMKLFALLLLTCLALSGCHVSGEIEDQAYVLILGIDRLPDGQLGLTARVPRIGSGSGKSEDGSSDSSYLTFSVSGTSWEEAREALEWATPRRANLSHIGMVVVSETLAREANFPELLRQVVETPHLYATARLVVCKGDARAFVDAGDTVIGTRLSAELRATLKHYADEGYIPDASLADAYFAVNSFYSDSAVIYAALSDEDAISDVRILGSPAKQRFQGAALLRQGVLVHTLSIKETQLLNLIIGRVKEFPVSGSGAEYTLSPEGGRRLSVEIDDSGAARLGVSIALSSPKHLDSRTAPDLEERLASAIEELIANCQALRCDPFGFAERAAGHFLTVSDWMAFDWRTRYAQASLNVKVRIFDAD